MIRNLTNFDLDGRSHAAVSGYGAPAAVRKNTEDDPMVHHSQEENKAAAALQEKHDLEEKFADEILFNQIAFGPTKKPSTFAPTFAVTKTTSVPEMFMLLPLKMNNRAK